MKRNIVLGIALLAVITTACRNPLSHKKEQSIPKVPRITAQPQDAAYTIGSTAQALTVAASTRDSGVLSFQWYFNTEDSNKDGTEISGETRANFIPPTSTLGIAYYYVVVTNTLKRKTAEIASRTARIEIGIIPLIITGLSAANKQYDGTTEATVIGIAVLDGLLDGDDVSLTEGTAAFADKNAGANKIVTFSGYSLEGADADNYSLSQPGSVTADIEFVSMVHIPGGTFEIGKDLGTAATGDETNWHSVTLTGGFYIGRYQVTQAQYQAVMGSLPSSLDNSYGKGNNYPVYYVSWYDALVFCNKLSVMEGLSPAYKISGSANPADWGDVPESSDSTWDAAEIAVDSTGYRLPTEAQWEYAAKGGNPLAPGWVGYTYSGSDTVDDVAWYSGNNGSFGTSAYGSKVIGTKAPNGLGIYDMSGNVYEWCWDWYEEYASEDLNDPTGAVSGSCRVIRGGLWGHLAEDVRSSYRSYFSTFDGYFYCGFRLARPGE